VIAGAAVAAYMDRPVEVVEATPPLSRVILEPESWLNVDVAEDQAPEQSGEEIEQLLAGHPPEATVTLPFSGYYEQLVGLPPGTYHVQASCIPGTPTLPPELAGPAWFAVEISDPASYLPAPESSADQSPDMSCDGDLYTVSARMTVTGYQAATVYRYSAFDELETYVEGTFVVVSFTPVS
jgi:hypothetical protein